MIIIDGVQEDGLLQDGSQPYGDVTYADPGFQEDKKKRYPLNSLKRVKAALSYIAMAKNAKKYTASQLASIKSKINAAAKRFGVTVSQGGELDIPDQITTTLILQEGDTPDVVITQEPDAENANGVMRVRVPFYRGGSLTRAAGFSKRLFFSKELLQEIVQGANDSITTGRPPLTVYARHLDALSGRELPIGAVTGIEQEGSTGYGILEIAPTSKGRDAQVLIQHKHVRSVSLRSGKEYELEPVKLDGESVLAVKHMSFAGIDLAPNGPAQDTYGMEILNEEPSLTADNDGTEVDQDPDNTRRKRHLDPITLEDVPQDVRAQIESPIRQELDAAKSKVAELTQEIAQRDLSAYIDEIANYHSKPEDARKVLQDLAKEKGCTTRDQLSVHVQPILLDILRDRKANGTGAITVTSPSDTLREMFAGKPAGSGTVTDPPPGGVVTQDGGGNGSGGANGEHVLLETGSFESAAGGLAIPED